MNQLKLQSQFCWWSGIWIICSFNYLLQFWCLDLVSLLIFADGFKKILFYQIYYLSHSSGQEINGCIFWESVGSDCDQFLWLLIVILGLAFVVILGQYQIKRFEFYEFFWFFGCLVDSDKRLKWSDVKILHIQGTEINFLL